MEEEKNDAEISVSYNKSGYSAVSNKVNTTLVNVINTNTTLVNVINTLCASASKQGKTIKKAKITMRAKATVLTGSKILTENKSL